ncbi:PLC-like phosphodiesterase [Atractiella rhizophila]|nr:PLC-like phosphodiesterase [Atractiella rhizophila]
MQKRKDTVKTRNWMSLLPDELSLSDLFIPGTHESCALFGYPISQCQQDRSLRQQLLDGIRFYDVRLANKKGQLLAYHGLQPQEIGFEAILLQCYEFLKKHDGETIIMSIKQEDISPANEFEGLVFDTILADEKKWYLERRIPTLKEARGKIVLFSRFGNPVGPNASKLGIHPSRWPNNQRGIWEWQNVDGVRVQTQDWYDISSFLAIPEKFDLIKRLILYPPSSPTGLNENAKEKTWHINFCSAATFLTAVPIVVAEGFGWSWFGFEGVNDRLMRLLKRLRDGKEEFGVENMVFLLDFYHHPSNELVKTIIDFNFPAEKQEHEK